VGSRIIDGEDWIAQRLRFLRKRLADNPSEAERVVLEQELAALSKERGIMPAGLRFPRLWRRLRRTR
jgi:hypothetical protein